MVCKESIRSQYANQGAGKQFVLLNNLIIATTIFFQEAFGCLGRGWRSRPGHGGQKPRAALSGVHVASPHLEAGTGTSALRLPGCGDGARQEPGRQSGPEPQGGSGWSGTAAVTLSPEPATRHTAPSEGGLVPATGPSIEQERG